MTSLYKKVQDRSAKAAVIGLGYVGLPLAVEMARAGFETIGFDLVEKKIQSINQGKSYINDVQDRHLSEIVANKKLKATSDFSLLKECDFISICVPTPLGKGKDPDMSFVLSVVTKLKETLRKGQVIILESTTYPGTTEELVLPLLEETGLKAGEDFYLSFSPERIDPGNLHYNIKNTPKVIGGLTPSCTEISQAFYQTFIDKVIPVRSPKTAEMVKILENTFRAINIGLANEIAIMCSHLNIDTWEVIEAAASKPFGFMPFYPGPGLGGHCIPVDPHYLVWKLRSLNYNPRFIQLADEINSYMPSLVVEKIGNALNEHRKSIKGSKILVLGVAYKKDIDDCRESPAMDVLGHLKDKGAIVDYHDPFVPSVRINNTAMTSTAITQGLEAYDCVAILTHHSAFNIQDIVDKATLIVDTRNATKGIYAAGKIVKL